MVAGEEDRAAELNPRPSRTCAVLGARRCFVARSLVSRLLSLGTWIVRVADSSHSLSLDSSESDSLLSHALASGRATFHHVDTSHKSTIVDAIEGSCALFYFDEVGIQSDHFYSNYMSIVQGAKNVIEACQECKVRRLIYNSSADVVFDGLHDIVNGDELLPYPQKFQHSLNELKANAETLILFANNRDGLLTCAIRPCNVFGPGDSDLVPFLVRLARSSFAKFVIGSGENISDFTYVENVSHAHICAEESLDFQSASVAGKAFFVSNLDPIKFWDFSLLILEGLGYHSGLVIKLPARMLWHIVLVIKWMHQQWGFFKGRHSEFHYIQLALISRTFNCLAAQKHIGYSPVVSLKGESLEEITAGNDEPTNWASNIFSALLKKPCHHSRLLCIEGVSFTVRSFSHLTSNNSLSSYLECDEPSKVEKLLGSGNVAEILLWRDENKSFTCFLTIVVMFYWFFLSGGTFASSAAKLALLAVCFLFGYGVLPPNVFGFPVKRLSSSYFEIPEVVVKESAIEIAQTWNKGFHCMRSLAKKQDWKLFVKVTAFLYVVKLVSSYSLMTIIGIALTFSFTAFFVYEQYNSEIDGLARLLFDCIEELAGLFKRNLPHLVS